MAKATDLKAERDDVVANLRKVATNLIEHMKGIADDAIANVKRQAAELAPLKGDGLDLVARAAAAVTMPIDLRNTHPSQPVEWLELRHSYNGEQVRLSKPIPAGRMYKAIVLVVVDDEEAGRG